MIYFFIMIAGMLLWFYFSTSNKSKDKQFDAQEMQKRQMEYRQARQAAKDEYRKRAIETYTKMGLGDLIHRMIIEESDIDGELQIRWAGLNAEQEERILKATSENDDTELMDIENELKPKVKVHINHADKVEVQGNFYDVHNNNFTN